MIAACGKGERQGHFASECGKGRGLIQSGEKMQGDREDLFIPFTKLCGCLTKSGSKNAKDVRPQQLVFSPRPSLTCITHNPITQGNFRSSPPLTALFGQRKFETLLLVTAFKEPLDGEGEVMHCLPHGLPAACRLCH